MRLPYRRPVSCVYSHPEFLGVYHREWLQPNGCGIAGIVLPGSPQGSEVHIWRAGIADCDILVCQFGKKVLHFSLVWKTHAGDQAQVRRVVGKHRHTLATVYPEVSSHSGAIDCAKPVENNQKVFGLFFFFHLLNNNNNKNIIFQLLGKINSTFNSKYKMLLK